MRNLSTRRRAISLSLTKPFVRPRVSLLSMPLTMIASDSAVAENRSPSQEKPMTYTADAVSQEMTARVRSVAALSPEDGRKAALRFAANLLRLSFGEAKRLYYGEVRSVPAHKADQIRAYCDAASKLIEARQKYEQSRAEFLAAASPGMARLAPPAIPDAAVPVDEQTKVKRT